MGSLLLIIGLGLWLIFVCFLAIWIAGKLPETWRRAPITIIVFFGLLPVPLADEFLAIPEFKQLCVQHTRVQLNAAKARGRTVHQAQDVFVEVKGTWVLTRVHQRRFVDSITGELLLADTSLSAYGGRFNPGTSAGPYPWFLDHTCHAPTDKSFDSVTKKLSINVEKSSSQLTPYAYVALDKSALHEYLSISSNPSIQGK